MSGRERILGGRAAHQPAGLPARRLALGLAGCLAVAALPVLLVDTPPIFDYANHLARAHILAHLDDTPAFTAHFVRGGFLIPNVLADLVVLALLPLTGAIAAGKGLLVLTTVLTMTGTLALSRVAHGRISVWPLVAATLVFNEGFFWGFLNYDLGLALLPWGLAAWLAAARLPPPVRLAVGAAAATAIFLAHLVAFGLYAVAVAVLELHVRPLGWRRLALAAAQFIPAAVLFFGFSPSSGLAPVAEFDFSVQGKITPFARLLSSGDPALDFVVFVGALAVPGLALATGRAALHPALGRVVAAVLALELTLPFSLMGSFFVDSRLVVAAALLAAAALGDGPRASPRASAVGMALLLALVGLRSLGLLADWRAMAREYDRVLAALDRLPRGSVLITAVGHDFELGDWVRTRHVQPAHEHTSHYATLRRDVIVPNIFARLGQNPLVFVSPVEALLNVARNPVARVFNDDDARWLVEQAQAVERQRLWVVPPIPAVFVIAYRFTCDRWPDDLPVHPVVCDPAFSLVRVGS